jgi:hypothetical protein
MSARLSLCVSVFLSRLDVSSVAAELAQMQQMLIRYNEEAKQKLEQK